MRVLLDECLARRLGEDLTGHEVVTVARMSWSGVKNGALLRLAASTFDVFVTIDRLLSDEQEVPPGLSLVTLRAASNRLEALRPLAPRILEVLESIRPGESRIVSAW